MQFSKELSVGNRILDSEHKKLYETISLIANEVKARNMADLLNAFKLLEVLLCSYFVVEEGIAQAANFDFMQHELAHKDLLSLCQHIKNKVMDDIVPEHNKKIYIDYLSESLIKHIKEDGKPLKIVLSAYPYDFNPKGAVS